LPRACCYGQDGGELEEANRFATDFKVRLRWADDGALLGILYTRSPWYRSPG
jgi:hypothetical protein